MGEGFCAVRFTNIRFAASFQKPEAGGKAELCQAGFTAHFQDYCETNNMPQGGSGMKNMDYLFINTPKGELQMRAIR
jgi:hypothetical protein